MDKHEIPEPLISEFLKSILFIMDRDQVSRTELAQRLGTSKAYISKVFAGENLSLKTIAKIAKALKYQVQFQFLELK